MEMVKIGSIYLNMDRATEIRDTGLEIEVFFETAKATVLRGDDAEKLRSWLDHAATDLNPPTGGERAASSA